MELLEHELWWNGPAWHHQAHTQWPHQITPISTEERAISLFTSVVEQPGMPILERFSSFTCLVCVTAWILRFVSNWCSSSSHMQGPLSVDELLHVERYWITVAQQSAFMEEALSLVKGYQLDSRSRLLSLHPLHDAHVRIHVGGRCEHASLS